MTTEPVRTLANELPEYTSNRGMPFRDVDDDGLERLAVILVRARSQQQNEDEEWWEYPTYRRHMIEKYGEYLHEAGLLGVDDRGELHYVWRNIVFPDSSPSDMNRKGMP